MTIRHLTVFLAVVDAGSSVSKAAERLHVAQPAVSQSIKDLEGHYGVVLFERLNRRLRLTAAGARLAASARRFLDQFADLEDAMKDSKSLPLRVGASYTVGGTILADVLARYREAGGGPAAVSVFNTDIIERMILEARLDVAIVEGEVVSADIRRTDLARDELICVGRSGTRLGAGTVWILREEGSGTRALAEKAFPIGGEAVRWEIANTQAITSLVRQGFGVTVISRRLVEEELKRGDLVEIRATKRPVMRMFRLISHKDKFIDERMTRFEAAARPDRLRGRLLGSAAD